MKHNTYPLFQVDAFTDQAFSGNPAAVCLLDKPLDEKTMQLIAAEMNLSETAFVIKRQNPDNVESDVESGHDESGHDESDISFDLRWFTPTVEVDLCGHATLATAHILWQEQWIPANEAARFHSKSGLLIATNNENQITLDFPTSTISQTEAPKGLLAGLGIEHGDTYTDQVDYMVHVEHEDIVHQLDPDFTALAKVPCRGIIVTAPSLQTDTDFISRFFAPASGINEDPVTGSAHCMLTPFWAEKLGKNTLNAYQASKRGGHLTVTLQGERTLIAGKAITTLKGELYV